MSDQSSPNNPWQDPYQPQGGQPQQPPAPAPSGMPTYASAPPAPMPTGDYRDSGLPAGVVPAPWWKRALARLIDGLVNCATIGVLWALLGDAYMRKTEQVVGERTVMSWEETPLNWAISIILSIVLEIVLVALLGGQIGKLAMGLRIAKAEDGTTPPGWGKAIVRYLMLDVVGIMTCCIGFVVFCLSPLWTGPKRQGYHDMVAKTLVVEKRKA